MSQLSSSDDITSLTEPPTTSSINTNNPHPQTVVDVPVPGTSPSDEPIANPLSEGIPHSISGNASAWLSSWYQTAKDTTWSTYELVKKDLGEFSEAVANEATNLYATTSTAIRESVPNVPLPHVSAEKAEGWMKGLTNSVNKILQVEDTTKDEEALEVPIIVHNNNKNTTGVSNARLYAIQTDAGTYCNDPDGAPELFDDWLDHFSLDTREKKKEIADLLTNNPEMRNIYTSLVPNKISDQIFWLHYFYKLHQFHLDEARRKVSTEKVWVEDDSIDVAVAADDDLTKEKVSGRKSSDVVAAELHEASSNVPAAVAGSPSAEKAGWVDWDA